MSLESAPRAPLAFARHVPPGLYRLLAAALICLALSFASDVFPTWGNLLNVLRQTALLFLIASGLIEAGRHLFEACQLDLPVGLDSLQQVEILLQSAGQGKAFLQNFLEEGDEVRVELLHPLDMGQPVDHEMVRFQRLEDA